MSYSALPPDIDAPDSFLPAVSTAGDRYPAQFYAELPAYAGEAVPVGGAADARTGGWMTPEAYTWGSSKNLTTDPEVYGNAGQELRNPMTFGPVESSTVEVFELNGMNAMNNIRRAPETNTGPVGYSDYMSILGAAAASDYWPAPSSDQVQANILLGM